MPFNTTTPELLAPLKEMVKMPAVCILIKFPVILKTHSYETVLLAYLLISLNGTCNSGAGALNFLLLFS